MGVDDFVRILNPAAIQVSAVAAVEEGFRDLLGPRFAVAAATPQNGTDYATADERAYIARAVPQRQAEFICARACARQALTELGVIAGSLVPHTDRSPRWPSGVRGSISHVATCCAVAVTCDGSVAGVGIDLEPAEPLDPTLIARVCTLAERDWLGGVAASRREVVAKLIFSAKEAAYKCQYPATRRVLDFLDLDLAIDLARGRFQATTAHGAAFVDWSRLQGRLAFTGGWILASAVMRP